MCKKGTCFTSHGLYLLHIALVGLVRLHTGRGGPSEPQAMTEPFFEACRIIIPRAYMRFIDEATVLGWIRVGHLGIPL